uniref:exodeoxyribonuclease III n=1 Tax=Xenopus tropicalis TaxID=8364 RepID=A0A803J3S5_XENTR
MDNIKIISWNVNGINSPIKPKRILQELKKYDADIALLQETHLNADENQKLCSSWVAENIYSPAINKKGGVSILFDKKLNFQLINTTKDNSGRFIHAEIFLQNQSWNICSVYAPNNNKPEFYRDLTHRINSLSSFNVIVGGDFNESHLWCLDKCGISTNASHNKSKLFSDLLDHSSLNDVWRILNPSSKEFTFYSHSHAIRNWQKI